MKTKRKATNAQKQFLKMCIGIWLTNKDIKIELTFEQAEKLIIRAQKNQREYWDTQPNDLSGSLTFAHWNDFIK
jgi:hypothetical protein